MEFARKERIRFSDEYNRQNRYFLTACLNEVRRACVVGKLDNRYYFHFTSTRSNTRSLKSIPLLSKAGIGQVQMSLFRQQARIGFNARPPARVTLDTDSFLSYTPCSSKPRRLYGIRRWKLSS